VAVPIERFRRFRFHPIGARRSLVLPGEKRALITSRATLLSNLLNVDAPAESGYVLVAKPCRRRSDAPGEPTAPNVGERVRITPSHGGASPRSKIVGVTGGRAQGRSTWAISICGWTSGANWICWAATSIAPNSMPRVKIAPIRSPR
jgi:hypothetical protein